ncbi:MAG TPA: hypothetical protein DEB35_13005, partial [Desulfuromonas sp.]|nr:hypothetical protein [Desulfuromonas sp.]
MNILRQHHVDALLDALERSPLVAILGPRQIGKTTLAREIAAHYATGSSAHFDLEDMDDLARLNEPRLALDRLRGLIVIDEIQL